MVKPPTYAAVNAAEAITRMLELYPMATVTRARSDLGYFEVTFLAPGTLVLPALGFYAVTARVRFRSAPVAGDGACFVREEGMSSAHPMPVPDGATFIHSLSKVVDYSWLRPHTVRAICISPAELERAARESGIADPERLEIVGSMLGRDELVEHIVAAMAAEAEVPSHPGQLITCESLRLALACHLVMTYGVLHH